METIDLTELSDLSDIASNSLQEAAEAVSHLIAYIKDRDLFIKISQDCEDFLREDQQIIDRLIRDFTDDVYFTEEEIKRYINEYE